MTISGTISNALSGLKATGRMADVTSNNLANALTEGYGRQSVSLGSSALGGRGSGVQIRGIDRAVTPDITAARRVADSETATLGPQAEALGRLGRAFGEAGSDQGLFLHVQELESSLRLLADTPSSQPRQLQVFEAAQDISKFLATLSFEAGTVRQNADTDIGFHVARVNGNLDKIDSLNAKIVRLSAGGRDVAVLVDERERLIDEVSALIPARTHVQPNGAVHLTTTEGLYLLAENPQYLEFSRSPIITPSMEYAPGGAGALSGLTLSGIDITPNSTHPQALREGAIAGNFVVRDDIGVTFNTQIDQFAADIIQRFEDPTLDPTLTPGNPGLFTDAGSAFDSTIVDGLARRIAVNDRVDPNAGGELSRLRDGIQSVAAGPTNSDVIPRAMAEAFAALRPTTNIPGVDGALSAASIVSSIAEATGVRRTNTEINLTSLTATRRAIASSESEQIGVNTDTEIQNLSQIEQAFSANIQVIQAASRMLDEILEIR